MLKLGRLFLMSMRVLREQLRVEIENEMRVFLESLDFEIEMRVSQKSGVVRVVRAISLVRLGYLVRLLS